MPTIKDIAKKAGVSHGTVSNVLNKKGNVSAKKIELVERIALEMGYNINSSAKLLRKGVSNNIAIVIPDNEIHRYRDLYKNISHFVEDKGYTSNLYISEGVAHKEKDIIKRILSNRVHSIIIISCLNKKDDYYLTLNFGDTNIVFVERNINCKKKNTYYFSYDANKIGQNIAKYIKKKNYKNIIYFSSRKIYSFENDIFISLTDEITNTDIAINQYSSDSRLNIQTAFEIIFSENKYDLIITTSKEKANIIANILKLSDINNKIKIITLATTNILKSDDLTEYELNYKKLGNYIANGIISDLNKYENIYDPGTIETSNKTFQNSCRPVKIACIKGPSEEALRYVSKIIYSSIGLKTSIISYKYDTLFKMIKDNNIDEDIDLIRFDMAWISSFGEKMFLPLDKVDYDFTNIFDSFITGIEKEYSCIGDRRYTLPFDPSMLLLFYRKDLFEDAIVSRLYYEKYKEELKPPKSFLEYNQIASFFTKEKNTESETLYGTTFSIDSPQSISCQFLPIYYYLGGEVLKSGNQHFNYDILKKSIFIMLETLEYTHEDRSPFWGDAMAKFASGDTAMSLTFSNRTSNVINSKVSNVLGKFDYETLPGEKQIIGGGVLGISKKSNNIETTCRFLEYFYSKEISLIFACLCGASSSKYVYENEEISNIYPWLKFVQKHLSNGRRRISGNSFNELDFEYSLGTLLKEVINGNYSIDDCIFNLSINKQ